VLIVMPVSAINARYIEHFGGDASRHAASRGGQGDATHSSW
jgi:hypothetical protein